MTNTGRELHATFDLFGPVENLIPRRSVAEDESLGLPAGEIQAGGNEAGDVGSVGKDAGRVAGSREGGRVVGHVEPEHKGHAVQVRLDAGDAPVVHETARLEDGVLEVGCLLQLFLGVDLVDHRRDGANVPAWISACKQGNATT